MSEIEEHEWHEKVFASMELCVCMKCGFLLNKDKPNKPCKGHIRVGLRADEVKNEH